MTATMKSTFEVDKKGLAKLLERRGKEFAVTELVQNSWDEASSRVDVTLTKEKDADGVSRSVVLTVEDDNPEGFADIRHAYTLFAESLKKADSNKRGRFNLGEKLVIAVCSEARIETVKGTIVFADGGRREDPPMDGRDAGSRFWGRLAMTDAEFDRVIEVVHTLLPPEGVQTTFNGVTIPARSPIAEFTVALRTERADAEGNLRPTTRKTLVRVIEPIPGEVPSLYELGIPVVETGDRWHVDVCVAPETRVLTSDLRYVEAGSVRPGDRLLGFDETRDGKGKAGRRRFAPSDVLHADVIRRPSYRLTFDDGTEVVCSADHQWLTAAGKRREWMTTEEMLTPRNGKPGSSVVRLLDAWTENVSRDAGYLAAAFDGEGWLLQKRAGGRGVHNRLGFAQNEGVMLDSVVRRLNAAGFDFNVTQVPEDERNTAGRTAPHFHVILANRANTLRFLGEMRPERLLAKLDLTLLGAIPAQRVQRLIAKEFLGEREVVSIGTSTRTFIAEGLASHNCQKVPINMDRDNVPPGYLRDVRAQVLNHCHHLLSEQDASAKWVDAALEDEKVEGEAVTAVVKGRFGDKAVIADPTDREAEKIAASKGYTVIPGGALSKGAWKNVKEAGAVAPAGQVTPSPNPSAGDNEVNTMVEEHWTPEIRARAEFAKRLCGVCLPEVTTLKVRIANAPQWPYAATWGKQGGGTSELTLNLGRLGFAWFGKDHTDAKVLALLIHEMAHQHAPEHLSEKFYDECCRMGALATGAAVAQPGVFA